MASQKSTGFPENDIIQPTPAPVAESPPKYASSKDLMVTPEKERPKLTVKSKPTFRQQSGVTALQDIPLEKPKINSTRRILTSMDDCVFDEQQAVETHLKGERARHEFIHKGSQALNYPHQAIRYSDLTSLQVPPVTTLEQKSEPSHLPRQSTTRRDSGSHPQQTIRDLYPNQRENDRSPSLCLLQS